MQIYERLNLNNPAQTGMGSRPKGRNPIPVQCGANETPTILRLKETRQCDMLAKISHTLY